MQKVYLIFDVLPLKEAGGLIATYANFVRAFKSEYDITIVSVFKQPPNDVEEFKGLNIITLNKLSIDNRFFNIGHYLKSRSFKKALFALWSSIIFFAYIPFGRLKTKALLRDGITIASSPAAAMFVSKTLRFILEIHTAFEYFWGNNKMGNMQISLISKPTLTIFRSKADAQKANLLFASTYIYNFVYDIEPEPLFNFNIKKNRVLFVGRLTESKNPFMLLDCAARIKQHIQDFELDIYGTGPLETALSAEIHNRNMQNYVHLKGFTNDKTIYRQYSLMWLTSNFEGLPLTVIEAMSNMVPTVSTNWGDAAQELFDSNNGSLCNTSEEFVQNTLNLLTDKQKLELYSTNARKKYLSTFTPEAYSNRWHEILDTL